MRLRKLSIVAVLAASALALSACSSASSPSSDATQSASAPAERTVTTDQGEIKVPGNPQRVVVLNYALAGYLYDLDVPVVATTSEDFDYEPAYSEKWGDKPKKNGTEFLKWGMDGFDYEQILGYKPDLIVAGGMGLPNGLATKAYDQLKEIAPTVIVSGKLTTWQQQLDFIADDLFGKTDKHAELMKAYDDRVAEVKQKIKVPATPVSVLSITADGSPYLLLEDRGLPQTLNELGFTPTSIAADSKLEPYTAGGDMAELSTEQVGQLLPDVPLVFITGFNTDTTDVATLKSQPLWAELKSFKDGHAYDLPYWTVRGDYDETMALLDIIERDFA